MKSEINRRTDAELLALLRDRVTELIDGRGLCVVAINLIALRQITVFESVRISAIIHNHAPDTVFGSTKRFRWPKGEAQPRIDWLEMLLKRVQNGEHLCERPIEHLCEHLGAL